MAWQDRLAGRSSHRSAQPATRRPTPPQEGAERAEAARRQVGDAWGVRYGQEVGGVRHAQSASPEFNSRFARLEDDDGHVNGFVDLHELNSLKPGTPEFTARYIPKPGTDAMNPNAPDIIERIQPHGPEGFATIRVDGYSGEVLDSTPTPLPTPGPGPIAHA